MSACFYRRSLCCTRAPCLPNILGHVRRCMHHDTWRTPHVTPLFIRHTNALCRLLFAGTRPLARCTAFTKVWSNAGEGHGVREELESLLVGADQGLTIWRPQAPTGYATLGDCITLSDAQPTFQVSACTTGTRLAYAASCSDFCFAVRPACCVQRLHHTPYWFLQR